MDSDTQDHTDTPGASPEGRHLAPQRRTMEFAAQELRLVSTLVLLMATGLFLALPFVLSIGSVVFLPLVTAIMLTIVLAPLADRLSMIGLPNLLASFLSVLAFIAVLVACVIMIMSPAVDLFDRIPAMIANIGTRFTELRGELAWLAQLNDQVAQIAGQTSVQQVVIAGPTFLEELAIATPTVVLEVLLTLLMGFFMIEGRVRMRSHLLLDRNSFGTSLKAARVMRDIQDRVASYILTVSLINGGVGVIVALGAWALGVEAPIMWGGLAALLNFLPYIGPMVMITLLALFGLGTTDAGLVGLLPAVAYLGLHAVESNLLTPTILGARFTMNPMLILIALSYFSWIWGVTGALLSVPILLTLTALIDHLGRPNLVGFIFGEPLFSDAPLAMHDMESGPSSQ